jgi:hypothetical protein
MLAPDPGLSNRYGMPNGIHIVIVVYGPVYTALLSEITLANLAAMVLEIPQDLRDLSRVRILTTESDMPILEAAAALKLLRSRIGVELLVGARLAGHERHGDYGPMVESQRLLVIEAARSNAALFFVGPDQIYNRGAFALFVDCLRRGYRLVIGPGPRINREAARPVLQELIAASADGSFALGSEQQIDLLFDHWHRINDQFLIEYPESIGWKAYVCYRPHSEEFLYRFFQGPTFVAWPRRPKDDFDGFVDHQLPELCCASWRDMYVVPDGNECLALDMTDDQRFERMELANFPRVSLLYSFFKHAAIKDLMLLYGTRTCRIHRGERSPELVAKWLREFDRVVDPLLALALAERWISRRLGTQIALVFQIVCMLNTHTLSFILAPFTPFLLGKWKANGPPGPTAPIRVGPRGARAVLTN